MPPTRTPRPPSFAQDLLDFAGKMKDVPYNDLAKTFFEAGWLTQLREVGVQPNNGMTLVSFDLYVGKSIDALERYDQLTMAVGAAPGPVSVAARVMARETVIFMLSGRLPPPQQPQQQAAPTPAPRPNGAGETVDMDTDQEDVILPGEKAKIFDEAPPSRSSLVSRREPDGLPIFTDLYAVGIPQGYSTGREVVEEVLDVVAQFLDEASLEQIKALAEKNDELITYVKDMGTAEQNEELLAMIKKRRDELALPPQERQRRRRQAAVPRAN